MNCVLPSERIESGVGRLPSSVPVIDTHVHVWEYAAPWMNWLNDRPDTWNVIRRDICWSELRGELDRVGVKELILVQASPNCEESRTYLTLAAEQPSILGVVGWVSLRSADATQQDLKRLSGPATGKLVGVRNNHGWAPDGEIAATPAVLDSCRLLADSGLTLDLHFRDQRELSIALSLADAVPDLKVIIDHLGKPLIRETSLFDEWKRAITELAARPNVYLKYSGWATFLGGARAQDVRGHVAHALKAFGVKRMMFGSNWPVALVADSYGATYQATLDAVPDLGPDAWRGLMRETALTCYGV